MNSELKISIITPSLNQGKYIEDNIRSVKNQDYKNIEHIIIDACSTDNTGEKVKQFQDITFISEKDTGPANAINKGFRKAKGDILAWLNADDYYENNIFNTVAKIFEEKKIDLLLGGITFVNEEKKLLFKEDVMKISRDKLIYSDPDMRQPCSFFSKKLFDKVGGLNESLKVVFDYDLFIKMLEYTNPYFVDFNIAYYRDHLNTITRKSARKQGWEIYKVSHKYGAKFYSRINKIILRKILYGRL
jgi:glycosyltransferase involved in cell wall biosynthesis